MEMPAFLGTIIGWLRAGYPGGVPPVDYVPLFALLGSQLTENEVIAVMAEVARLDGRQDGTQRRMDLDAAERAAANLLAALGIDLDREERRATPGRMARA